MTAEAVRALSERLAAGRVRGLGCAEEVAAEAVQNQATLQAVIEALADQRATVQARAANALKKVQAASPEALQSYGPKLLKAALRCHVPEARWNLLLLLGGLRLGARDRALAADLLFEALRSARALERVHALQALVDLSVGDEAMEPRVRPVLEAALGDHSAAMRTRARKLLPRLASR